MDTELLFCLFAIDVDAVVVVVVVLVAVVVFFLCFSSPIDNPQLRENELSNARRKFAERPTGVPWISSWKSLPQDDTEADTEAAATAMPRLAWEVGPKVTPPTTRPGPRALPRPCSEPDLNLNGFKTDLNRFKMI